MPKRLNSRASLYAASKLIASALESILTRDTDGDLDVLEDMRVEERKQIFAIDWEKVTPEEVRDMLLKHVKESLTVSRI